MSIWFATGWTQSLIAEEACFAEKTLPKKVSRAQQKKKSKRKKTVLLRYRNEPLVDIGNYLAQEQGINILFPSAPDAITQTATIELENSISLEQAWDIFYTLLDVSGYSLIKKANLYTIVKNNKEIGRESLPVYLGTPWHEVPERDERIRYLAYLSNIHVTDTQDNMVMVMLKELLSDNAKFQTDETSNSVLIVDKASNVRAVMRILTSLDQTCLHEDIEIITLRHVQAEMVESLFNNELLKTGDQPARYTVGRAKPNTGTYFSENVRIIAEPRNNTLIIFGKRASIDRIREFIYKYIDVELESGRSILHIYQLQYLRAEEFGPVLDRIIQSSRSEQPQQARAGGAQGSTRRTFENVIIRWDKPEGNDEGKYSGGNKLIIAARTKDWQEIKKLIEQLDIPQRQVIIEVLVADLTTDDTRLLGTTIRNPALIPIYDTVTGQSAQVSQVVIDQPITPATNTASDILGLVLQDSSGNPVSVASTFGPGTAALSINDQDGRTWGLGAIQKLFDHRKILQNPHIIATNNRKSKIKIGQTRMTQDEASGSTGGTTTATRKEIKAFLTVEITPRISSADSVNLDVEVTIDNFASVTNFANANTVFRHVRTNSNVISGGILALGGLTRVDTTEGLNQTPLLGKIPVVGWLFKQRSADVARTNLTVFISPTIIEPRLRAGVSNYTQDYINLAKNYSSEGLLFDNLKDPITRWFFVLPNEENPVTAIDNFVAKDEFKKSKKLELGSEGKNTISTAIAADYVLAQAPACPSPTLTEQEQKLASLIQEVDLLQESDLKVHAAQDTSTS